MILDHITQSYYGIIFSNYITESSLSKGSGDAWDVAGPPWDPGDPLGMLSGPLVKHLVPEGTPLGPLGTLLGPPGTPLEPPGKSLRHRRDAPGTPGNSREPLWTTKPA